MARGSAPVPGPAQPVTRALSAWARALSEVGGRNTLLWAPEHPGGYLDLTTAHPGGVSRLLAGRVTHLSDLVREPRALAEAIDVTREIHDRTRQLEEHRGLVSCFVAVGMATWDPPRPGASVASPVLLRECRLRPTSPALDDFHVDLSHSVEVNPVLLNYLRAVAGIAVDPVGLADLTRVASRFDPYPVYAVLRQSCAGIPGFTITPRLVIGTYPYAKAPMVADVTENGREVAQADLVEALAGDAPARERLRTQLPDLVPDPDLSRELLVLDADADQAAVVDAVRSGSQLVLEAPPGTGSTQTVANLVAALAHDGKRTLVVTRFPATVADLVDRLAAVGLGDLVLDLTRAGSDRYPVAARLDQRLRRALRDDEVLEVDLRARRERERSLTEVRQRLVDHADAMHERRQPWGVSVAEIESAVAALGFRSPAPGSRVRIRGKALRGLSRGRVDELAQQLRWAVEAGAWSDDPSGDPWYGARITTAEEVDQARQVVTQLAQGGLAGPVELLDDSLAEAGLPPARYAADWETALRTMHGVRDTLEIFRPEVFDVPLDEHLVATGSASYRAAADLKLGLLARWRVRRQTRWLLRPGRPPADLHAELLRAQQQRQAWHHLAGAGGRPEISPRLDEAQQVYDDLDADLAWLGEHLPEADADLSRVPMPFLRQRVERLAARLDRLEVLPAVTPTLAALRDAGMGEVIDDFARRSVPADQVRPELEHIWWSSLGLEITDADPRCREHTGVQLHEAAGRFRALDAEHRDDTAQLVRARVAERAREQVARHPEQAQLMRAQATGERRLLPFADLLGECEDVLTALHPCLALSPYAVGHLVPPGTRVDLVVVQDATSVTTAEVVSALSRANRAVVVGDPAGVRPSSFVVGPTSPRDGRSRASEAVPSDTPQQGLLDDAKALLPARALRWRHGPLDARLAGPAAAAQLGVPGARMRSPVRLERVDGTARVEAGEESAIEWTEAEVARIAQIVLDHARTAPEQSLGVVTLTRALAREVEAALRRALHVLTTNEEADPALAFFDADRREPVTVGDLDTAYASRDVLIVGVGYGRTPHGAVLHRFPSLAAPQAQRRLAGVPGLARKELVVVSSLSTADLDPERRDSSQAAALRELLGFAERGDSGKAPQHGTLDPLVSDLATRLRHEGLTVEPQVGPGPGPVELAVGERGGERFLVAVETDGRSSAALTGVRERERLRVQQLEQLGWVPVRVWTSDLSRDPRGEVARVVAAVRGTGHGGGMALDRAATASGPNGAVNGSGSADRIDGTPLATSVAPWGTGAEQASPSAGSRGAAEEEQAGSGAAKDAGATGPAVPAGTASSPPSEETAEPAGSPAPENAEPPRERRRRRWRRDRASEATESTWDDILDDSAHDRWLKEQRPPHWE